MKFSLKKMRRMAGLLIIQSQVFAATLYVSPDSDSNGPGTNWPTAFHVIQDAVTKAGIGDTVLVNDGIYDAGGAEHLSMSNRVVLKNAVLLESVNGPEYTIISGEGPAGPSAVRCAFLTEGAMMSGFTLTNGHTLLSGDSMKVLAGGGIVVDGGSVSNCVLTGNSAFAGGAVHFRGPGTVSDCIMAGNEAAGDGGAVYVSSEGTLDQCVIINNESSRNGGGAFCENGGVFTDCILSNNTARGDGGGAFCENGGSFDRCIISGNEADFGGGANLFNVGFFDGCSFSENDSLNDGGAVFVDNNGSLMDCEFFDNFAAEKGGGVFFENGGVADGCLLEGNSAGLYGGAVYIEEDGLLEHCMLLDNDAQFGGGVNCIYGGTLNQCILSGNHAVNNGGAVYIDFAGTFNFCTLIGNTAEKDCGGVYDFSGGELNNCMVWDNGNGNWISESEDWNNTCTTPETGNNCVTSDPLLSIAGDFRLSEGSPCIDAGIPVAGILSDYEGVARPLDGDNDGTPAPDIGAFEFSSLYADTDGDGALDYHEYVADTDGTDSEEWFGINWMSDVSVQFLSSASREYTLMYRTNLVEDAWYAVDGQVGVPGTDGMLSMPTVNGFPNCFFRVMVEIADE